MNREERKRRFNEAIVSILYPSPSPPQQTQAEDAKPLNNLREAFDSNIISGDDGLDGNGSSFLSDEDGDHSVPQKLTRAQRKRLRKKRLKEEASRRGKMIGPLLPTPSVRENAGEKDDSGTQRTGESSDLDLGMRTACSNSKKLKNRRMAKRDGKRKVELL